MPDENVNDDAMVVLPSPPTARAATERFTGDVWVDGVTDGAGPGTATLATVRFSPGARTAWHRHANGQTLRVTDGLGIVRSRDGHTILMRPGDTVYTPPGVWHWHGAMPDSFMTHLALSVAGGVLDWAEHVTDDEYAAATGGGRDGQERATTGHISSDRRVEPLTIAAQGSFAVGGTVVTRAGSFDPGNPMDPAGQTLHGDHARVSFQVPVDSRPLPLLFWHGWWVDSSCWDTTPDGREGFRTLFLRRGFPVYLLDQSRRGSAGKTTAATTIPTDPNEQWFFNQFRLGEWPDLFEGGQFSDDPAALEQFFRAMVPDTGRLDGEVIVAGASAAIDRIGPVVLVTHSHAGGFGWTAAIRNNENVRAVVSIEPGSGFVFPQDELPEAMPGSNGTLEPVAIPLAEFEALTRVPVVVYYGDNIPTEPTDIAGHDNWRTRIAMARLWVEAINRHGGDATLVSLPERGIRGNTHFAFSDLNNHELVDQITAFLAEKNLD